MQTPDWTLRDSAGVSIVANHPVQHPRGCLTIDSIPHTIIRSGDDRGDSAPLLFRVLGGAVLRDGRIVLLNAGSRQLLFYAADGTYLRVAGGSGSGPGEFIEPTWFGRGGADTLWVWDDTQRRLTSFDGTGGLLASEPIAADGGGTVGPSSIGGRFADGSFLASPGGLGFFSGEKGIVRLPVRYARLEPGTGRVTPLAEGWSFESVVDNAGMYTLPFGKSTLFQAHGDLLVVGETGSPTLRFHGMDGELRRVVRWESDPVPVSAADRSAYPTFMATISPRAVPPADAIYAEQRPVFSALTTDRTGWLWVRQYAPAWESPAPWLVFDGRGVLQCEVSSPGTLRVLEIGEGYLLAVVRNALDEETVVQYRTVRRP